MFYRNTTAFTFKESWETGKSQNPRRDTWYLLNLSKHKHKNDMEETLGGKHQLYVKNNNAK